MAMLDNQMVSCGCPVSAVSLEPRSPAKDAAGYAESLPQHLPFPRLQVVYSCLGALHFQAFLPFVVPTVSYILKYMCNIMSAYMYISYITIITYYYHIETT